MTVQENDARPPKIAAVILTYNCERMLPRALERIPRDLVDEILVVDDASADRTSEIAKGLGLKIFVNERNRGYGGNLKRALQLGFATGADFVVEIHGDGAQFDPISIKYALPHMAQGADLILGSRFQNPRQALRNGMPIVRFVANRFLSFFDRLVLGLPLTEFHTGFRIYSRSLFETLPLDNTADNYLFSFQVIAQAAYFRLKVEEVPVEADYISEHTSHSLGGAAVYAVNTFGVLGEYLLARRGIRHSSLFPQIGR